MAVFHSFLWLNNASVYRCAPFRLPILWWVDVWVVPTFCQLWRKLLGVRFQPLLAQFCAALFPRHSSLLPLLSLLFPLFFSFLFLPPVGWVWYLPLPQPQPGSRSLEITSREPWAGPWGFLPSLQGGSARLAAHPWESRQPDPSNPAPGEMWGGGPGPH